MWEEEFRLVTLDKFCQYGKKSEKPQGRCFAISTSELLNLDHFITALAAHGIFVAAL
jgi:hypothetical protein